MHINSVGAKSRVQVQTTDEHLSKPMGTFLEKLWFLTSDQHIVEVLRLNRRQSDGEFKRISSQGQTHIPQRSEIIPEKTHEGSIWVRNKEQHESIVTNFSPDDYPLRVCYYVTKDEEEDGKN